MHQPPIVPRLNLGNQENVMTERVTMDGSSPCMVEKVTMDRGSSVIPPTPHSHLSSFSAAEGDNRGHRRSTQKGTGSQWCSEQEVL